MTAMPCSIIGPTTAAATEGDGRDHFANRPASASANRSAAPGA